MERLSLADAGLEGHILAPRLDDPAGAGLHTPVSTFGPCHHAVRSARWRSTGDVDELYKHDEAPHEWRSLVVSEPRPKAGPQVIAALRERQPVDDAPLRGKAEGSAGLDASRSAQGGRQGNGHTPARDAALGITGSRPTGRP